MKYAWIELHSRQWPVSLTCQVLGVSPSGYHARKARDVDTDRARRRISNDALLVHIKAVHAESKGEYGWPRVWKKLLAQGIRVSKDRVQQLMKLHGIRAKTKRRFKSRPTATTACRSHRTCCNETSLPRVPTRSGLRTSRTSGRTRVGCF